MRAHEGLSDRSKGPELAILINMEDADVPFTLPTGKSWKRVLDTQSWFDSGFLDQNPGLPKRISQNINAENGEAITTATYGVTPRSIVILEAK